MTAGRKIFGAFTIAIALFFFWPAVMGSWQEVSALRAAVAEREQLLATRQEILANISSEYNSYTSKIQAEDGQRFSALVPVRKDTAELVSAMEEIANTSGVSIGEIRMSENQTAESAQFKTLTMEMELTGSYSSLRTFLTDLEKYVRLLNVDSIEVSGDIKQAGQLKFAIRANTYFIK